MTHKQILQSSQAKLRKRLAEIEIQTAKISREAKQIMDELTRRMGCCPRPMDDRP